MLWYRRSRRSVLLPEVTAMATYEQTVDAEFLARLRQFVRWRLPTGHDAEDLVQDALVKLLHKGGSVPAESARAWLFTVARNLIRDRWRAPRRGTTLPADAEDVSAGSEDRDAFTYLARCMEPMLATMTADDRDLLRRVDILEESQAEIARALDVSASVVKSRVQRARRRLRAILEGCCTVEKDRRGTPISYRLRPDRPCPCSEPGDFEGAATPSRSGGCTAPA